MAGTDFVDEDLHSHEQARRRQVGAVPGGPGGDVEDDPIKRPVSDLNLTRMGRHRAEVEGRVAHSAEELDQLRMREEALERERRDLEELRSRQASYESGRKDISDKLQRSLVMLDREQKRADRRFELLQTTRGEFQAMLDELQAIDDESWLDDDVRDELAKCLVLIEECDKSYSRSMARVNDELRNERRVKSAADGGNSGWPTAGYWFRVGWLISIPLLVVVAVLSAAWWFLVYQVVP